MRTAQRLAALGVVAAIVLSGCSNGKDSYSSAEKEESSQQSEATQKMMLLRNGTGGLTMAEYIKREALRGRSGDVCP